MPAAAAAAVAVAFAAAAFAAAALAAPSGSTSSISGAAEVNAPAKHVRVKEPVLRAYPALTP
jgi:hypothetical protein